MSVAGERIRASWSLCPLRGELANKQEKAFAAAGTDPRTVRRFRVGRRIGGVRAHLGWWRRALPVEQKQLTRTGGVLRLAGCQRPISDFVQTLGQDVLEEAAHELLAGDAAHPPAVGFAMLVADGDSLVVEADDASIGDRDAEDVAGEIIEHGLLAFAPGRAMATQGLDQAASGRTRSGRLFCNAALSLPRTSLANALTGTRKARRAELQLAPSSETPPPVTKQWTCGW